MTQTIQFELVSPEERLISQAVAMAVIPGDEGDLGVMPEHASLVASLRPGVVTLYEQQGQAGEKIFIAGGFADVTAGNCTVLAEEAIPLSSMDESDLMQTLQNLKEDLGLAAEELDKKRIGRKIDMVLAKISAVRGKVFLS